MKKTFGEKVFDNFNVVLMCAIALITLYPLVYVFSMSISDPINTIRNAIFLYPIGFSLQAYKMVFMNPDIYVSYLNTIFYTVVGTSVNLIMTVLAAYPLSRKDFTGRRPVNAIILFTMFFSGGLIPNFILINSLGLYNHRAAMIFPIAIDVFNIIIARTYFQTIPDSMAESAKIDGANDFIIVWRIIVPLSAPIIAVVALFCAVNYWNSYFLALIYLPNPKLQPIQLYLYKVLTLASNQMINSLGTVAGAQSLYTYQIKYACIIVVILPILFVYPFLQKYFVKGVMIGALKE